MPGTDLFINAALPDVEAWTAAIHERQIPILEATSQALEDLRAVEDSVDAHMLAGAIADDPLMTLKLLRHVSEQRSSRFTSDVETVTAAVVLFGITPFFSTFQDLPTVERRLASQGRALEGLRAVLQRAHRSARFALAFAAHRLDHDAAVIHEAALLHDFAEMLVWLHAPILALAVSDRLSIAHNMRTADAQRETLGITLASLQQALMRKWRLPELLIRIADDQTSVSPQVRNVQLAMRVARHSANGWDNPALPEDMLELCDLLNLGLPHVQQLLLEIDS